MSFYEHTLVAKQDLSTTELDKIHDKYSEIIKMDERMVVSFNCKIL